MNAVQGGEEGGGKGEDELEGRAEAGLGANAYDVTDDFIDDSEARFARSAALAKIVLTSAELPFSRD